MKKTSVPRARVQVTRRTAAWLLAGAVALGLVGGTTFSASTLNDREAQIAEMRDSVAALEAEVDALEVESAKHAERAADTDRIERKHESAKLRVEELEAQLGTLQADLDTRQTRIAELEAAAAAAAAAPAAQAAPSAPAPAPAQPAPAAPAPAAPAQGTVHPGSFCSTAGATGVTAKGTAMVCTTTSSDSRLRWRAA